MKPLQSKPDGVVPPSTNGTPRSPSAVEVTAYGSGGRGARNTVARPEEPRLGRGNGAGTAPLRDAQLPASERISRHQMFRPIATLIGSPPPLR